MKKQIALNSPLQSFFAVGYIMRVGLSQQSLCEAVKILELWERGEINRRGTSMVPPLFCVLSLPFST